MQAPALAANFLFDMMFTHFASSAKYTHLKERLPDVLSMLFG